VGDPLKLKAFDSWETTARSEGTKQPIINTGRIQGWRGVSVGRNIWEKGQYLSNWATGMGLPGAGGLSWRGEAGLNEVKAREEGST